MVSTPMHAGLSGRYFCLSLDFSVSCQPFENPGVLEIPEDDPRENREISRCVKYASGAY